MIMTEEWTKVKTYFLSLNEVQKQGESLKIRKKMFVFFNKDSIIVKLPKKRVTQLLESGVGLPYDPGNGKIMKEWMIIPSEKSERWIEFASEAKEFAKKIAK